MSRVYFEGWYSGAYVQAGEWYRDHLVYVHIRLYHKSTAVDRPDEEKSFLLKLNDPERVREYDHTIAAHLSRIPELRDADGHLVPMVLKLPPRLFQDAAKPF